MTQFNNRTTDKLIDELDNRAEDIREVEEKTAGGTLVSTNTKVMMKMIKELKERKEEGDL